MNITIVTPLFPPDIADPAPYCKELAGRLSDTHGVRVLLYGNIPEAVSDVQLVTVPKSNIVFPRLAAFAYALYQETKQADCIFVQNGASVELPAIIIALITRTPFILYLSDERAVNHSKRSIFRSALQKLTSWTVTKTVPVAALPLPLPRSEILPFVPKDEAAFAAYEMSWQEHLRKLEKILTYAKS